MLKLNASYSKKVPAESEYSSQSYHCTIEVELPDGLTGQQLQEKVHSVFDFVRNSVEAELHDTATRQPVQTAQAIAQPVQQSHAAPQQAQQSSSQQYQNRQYRNAVASPKQVNYLLSLARRAGWTVQQILQRCQIASIEEIPSKVCSQLIQEFSGSAA
jgi:predicted PilT family ATPase